MIEQHHKRIKAQLDAALKTCIMEATDNMTPGEIFIEAMNYRNTPAVRQALFEHACECAGIDPDEVRKVGTIGCQTQY